MSDQYESVRSLSLAAVAPLLGIDLSAFKKRKNKEVYGPCPVHKPKANQTSFSYAPDGKWHCFSCEAKGRGAIDLAMQVLHIGFKDACERLSGIQPLPEAKEHATEAVEANSEALKPLKASYAKFQVPCEWLDARTPKDIQERYGVFCYNNPQRKSVYSGKVMIPITKEGELYGYLARAVDGEPKYLFPKGLPKHLFLFGQDQITEPVKVLYLVESPFAVMKFASLGLPAVSPFGWSVSPEQLDILNALAKGVVYLPDRNKYEDGKSVASLLAGLIKSQMLYRLSYRPNGINGLQATAPNLSL